MENARKKTENANVLWLFTIIVYLGGASPAAFLGQNVFGIVIMNAVLFLFLFSFTKSKKGRSILFLLAAFLTAVTFFFSVEYRIDLLSKEIMAAALYYICTQRNKKSFLEYCPLKKIPLKQWLFFPILSLLLFWIGGYINALSMVLFDNAVTGTINAARESLVTGIISLALIPAVVEECIYRGCIYHSISGKKKAVIISALFFALMHMNFNQMSYAFVLGLLFAVIMGKTDNLSVSVVIHFLFNLLNIILPFMMKVPLLKKIIDIHIGNYYLFGPSLCDSAQHFYIDNLLTGLLVVVMSVVIIMGILHFFFCNKEVIKENQTEETKTEWRPDGYFWAGCAVCIFIASAFELMKVFGA